MKSHSILLCVLLLSTGFLVNAIAAPLPTDGSCLLSVAPGLVTGFGEGTFVSGSAFALGDGIGNPDPQQIDEWLSLQPGSDGGIIIGTTQPKRAVVDRVNWWEWIDHSTVSPVFADCGTGYLDFSGWTMYYMSFQIPMGSVTDYTITCSGSTYEISGAHVVSHPTDANYLHNGVVYTLHLEGDLAPGCVTGCTVDADCDDGDVCTDDTCDPATGCVNAPNMDPCDDGDACTTGDVCSGGSCSGILVDCNDTELCTVDSCDPVTGTCQNVPNCDDGNICTDDFCDPALGCIYAPNSNSCDDGDACTFDDGCWGKLCAGTPVVCPQGEKCKDGVCIPGSFLPADTLLTIAPGLVTGQGEGDLVSGCGFAMGDGIGNPMPGQQIDGWNELRPGTDGGIIVGQTQVRKSIDAVWMFFSAKGWHYTSAAPTADDVTGALDFTGWTVFWNGGDIPMGDATSYTYADNGDGTYQINGVKVVSHPTDLNFTFNGVIYTLHLEGDIIPPPCVPVPEICDDGMDNDCDGLIDQDDPDCCALEICDDGIDNDCDGIIDGDDSDCCTGSISATIRGGGQRPTTTDRQIMVEFSVREGRGCIVDSGVKSVTVTPGTKLGIDWTAGSGPPPTEVTLDGAVVSLNDVYMLTVNAQHKLVLTNKGNGGKDTDRITIDVVP